MAPAWSHVPTVVETAAWAAVDLSGAERGGGEVAGEPIGWGEFVL